MVQINHGGAEVDPAGTPDVLSPSGVALRTLPFSKDVETPRAMTEQEIEELV